VGEGLLPEDFRFGVATAGFQIEGGYNGPRGEPRNNWYDWESDGRVEPSGIALDFWKDYERQLDLVAALGCNSFRISVEWARCEPAEGRYDDEAFARYAAILDACHARGLDPLVTVHHFTHPWWLGDDLWLGEGCAERFGSWAEVVAERLGSRCRHWVTINEANILALSTRVLGAFPPGRRGDLGGFLTMFDNLAAAHVQAYGAIKSRVSDAVVSWNPFSMSVYELDRMVTDILLARSNGIDQHQVGDFCARRREAFYASAAARGAIGPTGASTRRWPRLEASLRRFTARVVAKRGGVGAFSRTLAAVYASPYERTLDVVQIDYYDPETASHLQPPLRRTSGGRLVLPNRPLWEDPPNPAGLVEYAAANDEASLDMWIVENGLCNRVLRGRSYPRPDGWTRDRYLRANLGAVVEARERGIAITGYWHWCLGDNYEWGSYEPRFGLFGVDRERGLAWSDLDAMGVDAAGTYRELIKGLRAGDRSVVDVRA
jgi:beta-glucosidase/6-phospho-beta-glucosidase/beta-galactosidase